MLSAQQLQVQGYMSIAPVSIPVKQLAASPGIGMTRVDVRSGSNGTWTSISSLTLQLTGTVDPTRISELRVYFEDEGQPVQTAGTYDHGSVLGGDVLVATVANPFDLGSTITVNVPPATVRFDFGASKFLYAVFDFEADPGSASTAGCEITALRYGADGVGDSATATSVTHPLLALHTVTRPLDDYEVTLTATGLNPGPREQGTQNVGLLELEYDVLDPGATAHIDTITVTSTSTRHLDIAAGGVLLYEDSDDNGLFDPDVDLMLTAATPDRTTGVAVLNPYEPITFSQRAGADKVLFVAVNLAISSVVGNTVGLQVLDPAAGHVFQDLIFDDNFIYFPEYAAYVYPGFPYEQEGYITSSTATPTTGNTFTVTGYSAFLVTSVEPASYAENVALSANVRAGFNKPVKVSTLDGHFTLTGSVSGPISGAIGYDSGTDFATFDPAVDFAWGETVTAVVDQNVLDTADNPLEAQKTWTFTVEPAVYPTVLSTFPVSGQTGIDRTADITITFSKFMNVDTIDETTFTLSGSVSGAIVGTVSYDPVSRTATFDPAGDLPWGDETLTATVTTDVQALDGLALQADKVWSFTTVPPIPPVVLNTTPRNNVTEVLRSSDVVAVFSENVSGVDGTTFTLRKVVGGVASGPSVAGGFDYNPASFTATLTPPIALLDFGAEYEARITTAATDDDGLAMEADKVWRFTVEQPVYPTVTTTTPANGATEVSLTADVTATFSKDMDDTTIDETTFTLSGSVSGAIAGTVSYDPVSRTVTFDPTQPALAWGEYVTATITTAVQAADGLALQADKVWTFQTTIPIYPQVLNTSPMNSATKVSRGTTVTATFSKDMDDTTIDETTFTVRGSGGAGPLINGTVTYDPASRTATFELPIDTYFVWEDVIEATITTAVQATDGLALQADKVWTFTVRESNFPYVSSTTPADGSRGVAITSPIKVSFTKTMDETTLAANFSVVDSSASPVAGTLTYDANTSTLTFAPTGGLSYNTEYTVTITGGAGGMLDVDGMDLAVVPAPWTFTTFGDFAEPTVTNNVMMPGSTEPMRIFIPEPPRGPTDRVTVQVFTANGRRVATLADGRPYQDLLADLPLVWDGTNGRSQRLGPGVYFIQIRATDYRKVVKVMIVR